MKRFLLISLAVLMQGMESCKYGCLVCTEKNICQVCNTNRQYYLNNNKCIFYKKNDCSVLGQDGQCLQCAPDYYTDPLTHSCLPITPNRKIDNCLIYNDKQQCILCSNNFYPFQGQCEMVTLKIDNCDLYGYNQACYHCTKEFIPSSDRSLCLPLPSISNCNNYTYITCKQCQEGHYMNANSYILDRLIPSNYAQDILFKLAIDAKSVNWAFPNICAKTTLLNCKRTTNYQTCLECYQGHFLEANQCLPNPLPKIDNCFIYASLTQCSICEFGFQLTTEKYCKAFTALVTNCIQYDTTTITGTCQKCSALFYVNEGDNTCKARTTTSLDIVYCKILVANNDTQCQTCNDNYILTSDQLKCLPLVDYCPSHITPSSSQTFVNCQTCSDGYYLVTKESGQTLCEQIYQKKHCSQYSGSACTECQNGYYLLNQECWEHQNTTDCELYSDSIPNQCTQCKSSHALIQLTKNCKNVKYIKNCKSYSSTEGECQLCEEGYYISPQKSCYQIPPQSNCKEMSVEGFCNTCKDNFVLDVQNKMSCIKPISTFTQYCHKLKPDITLNNNASNNGMSDYCQECDINTFPYALKKSRVCIFQKSLSQLNIVPINGCKVQNNNGSCMECEENLYLNFDNTKCLNDCVDQIVLLMDISKYIRKCVDVANLKIYCKVAMIAVYKQTTYGEGDYACIELRDGYLPFIDKTKQAAYKMFKSPVTLAFNDHIKPSTWSYNGFGVLGRNIVTDFSTITNLTTIQKVIQNCELFFETGTNALSCYKCKFGDYVLYGGDYNVDISQNNTFTAIYYCKYQSGMCNNEVRRGGFPAYVNAFLSCHQCLDSLDGSPSFPLLRINTVETNFFNLKSVSGNSVPIFNCSIISKNNLVDNCSVYAQPDDINAPFECLACQPNMAATYKTGNNQTMFVSKCLQVENCNLEKQLAANMCSECFNNNGSLNEKIYAFKYVDFSCIRVSSPFCLFASSTDSTFITGAKKCEICLNGYALVNETCIKLQLPFCSNNQFSTTNDLDISSDDDIVKYQMYNKGSNGGCQKCQDGYFLFSQETTNKQMTICMSSYNRYEVDDSQNLYVDYCLRYTLETESSKYKCAECIKSYVLKNDKTECLSSDFENCLQLNAANDACSVCLVNYTLSSGKCVQQQYIKNCKVYENQITCKTCQTGFYLSEDSTECVKGHLNNCLQYELVNSIYRCKLCMENYVLIKDGDISDCFQIPKHVTCATYTQNQSQTGPGTDFECTSCKKSSFYGYILQTLVGSTQSLCLPYNLIPNCLTYQSTSKYVNACSKCKEGYFVYSDYECKKRKNFIQGCVAYKDDEDRCSQCGDKYLLVQTPMLTCVPYPAGVQNCQSYSNNTTCSECKSGFYLSASSCLAITTAVANCLQYSNATICSSCKNGFYLSSNSCIANVGKNCLTTDANGHCASCDAEKYMVLKTVDSVKSCVQINISNCRVPNMTDTEKCIECLQSYYPIEGICYPISKYIHNCYIYQTATTCLQCANGYALSVDKSACLQYLDQYMDNNCEIAEVKETAVCMNCAPGHYFSGDSCISCSDQTIEKGCMYCKPSDNKICLICQNGYYMKADLKCYKEENIWNPLDKNSTEQLDKNTIYSNATNMRNIYFNLDNFGFDLNK